MPDSSSWEPNEKTLLVRCSCHSLHFVEFYDDGDMVYVSVQAVPRTVWDRIKDLFRSRPYLSEEIVLDSGAVRDVAAFLAKSNMTQRESVRSSIQASQRRPK